MPIFSDSIIKAVMTDLRRTNLSISSRNRRQTEEGKVKATVDLAVFTEHLLYLNYCPSPNSCEEGIIQLTDYVQTLVFGVSVLHHVYFHHRYIRV